MGIEVYRGSLDSQAGSTGTMIEQQLKAYESLETSNRKFCLALVWPSLRLF